MRAIIMLCLGLWAALLLNPGEVYAQRGLPGQVALGVNGGIADGFSFRDSHGAYRFWGELELTRYTGITVIGISRSPVFVRITDTKACWAISSCRWHNLPRRPVIITP